MRILVTGARGQLGQRLLARLASHDLVPFTHDDGDVADPEVVAAIAAREPEVVVHLAAVVGAACDADPARAVATNVTGTLHVATAARRCGARLVYASTASVYGGPHDDATHVEHEHGPPPRQLYGATKLWGEQAAAATAPEGLQVVRIANPYGPGQQPGAGRGALTNMAWQAHHRLPMPVFAAARRCFCHFNDVVDAIALVIERGEQAADRHDLDSGTGIYNVGRDDEERELLDIARVLCEMAGSPSSLIEVLDAPPFTMRYDMGKLRALGFAPRVPLEHGLSDLLGWVGRYDRHGALVTEPIAGAST